MTEGKTMRELWAIVDRDRERFNKLGKLWDELTEEYQDELLALAVKRSAELDTLELAAAFTPPNPFSRKV